MLTKKETLEPLGLKKRKLIRIIKKKEEIEISNAHYPKERLTK